MISSGYRLDSEGIVLEQISDDVAMFIVDKTQELAESKQGKFVLAAAELLVPEESTLLSAYRRHAFCSGAATAIAAFGESDLPKTLQERTQKQFVLQSAPISLLHNDNEQTIAAFEREADKGLRTHPELGNHLDFVSHYLSSITQDQRIGRLSFTGAGIVLERLDRSLDAVWRAECCRQLGYDIGAVDWSEVYSWSIE